MSILSRIAAVLLLCASAWATTPVTVTGTIEAPNGQVATSGYVEFDLTPQNSAMAYQIPSLVILAPQKARCGINASGLVKNLALSGACQIWGNDVITPSNSLYKIIVAPNGTISNTIQNALISGSAVDMSSLTLIAPQPVIGTVINASPLVTESVIPAQNSIWSLGDPLHYYSNIWVTRINCLSCTGGPVLSVFGRTGTVVAANGDYNVSQVTGAAPSASPTFSGTMTFPDGLTWDSSGTHGTFTNDTLIRSLGLSSPNLTTLAVSFGNSVAGGKAGQIISTPNTFTDSHGNVWALGGLHGVRPTTNNPGNGPDTFFIDPSTADFYTYHKFFNYGLTASLGVCTDANQALVSCTSLPTAIFQYDNTGLTATNSQTLGNAPSTGTYRVNIYEIITRAASVSSALGNVTATSTDPETGGNPACSLGTSSANTVNTVIQGVCIVRASSGNPIFFASGYASSGGTTMQYSVHVTVEKIN